MRQEGREHVSIVMAIKVGQLFVIQLKLLKFYALRCLGYSSSCSGRQTRLETRDWKLDTGHGTLDTGHCWHAASLVVL